MMNIQAAAMAGPSTSVGPGPSRTWYTPLERKKRPSLSDRIQFTKARLNRVANKERQLFPAPEDRFAEPTDLDDDTQLLEAAKCGKHMKVREILPRGYNRDFVDENGRSALHWAAEYGYIKIVYILLDLGWNIDLVDDKQHSPLHVACDHHNGNIAACLIAQGCKIRIKDANGNTPLHRAIHGKLETIACMLCNLGADVNAKTGSDWTPLHEAARVGDEYVARKLIKYGADVNAVSKCKATPFLTAVFYYRISHKSAYSTLEPILKVFIQNGCQLSESDGQWCPLLSAISVYNSQIAGLLLYHGCIIERQDVYGRSLLVDAFTKCDTYVVKLLIMAGYRVTPDEVEQCSRRIPTFSLSFLKLAFPGYEGKGGLRCLEILRYLREKASTPFSLQAICRTSIRISLNKASGDRSILDRIPLLPLPSTIRQDISLSDYATRFV